MYRGQKFYAVARGRRVGIYRTWEACRQQVEGYSNNRYKSFSTRQQAEEFIEENRVEPVERRETGHQQLVIALVIAVVLEEEKKLRKPLRSIITRICNEINQELAQEVPDVSLVQGKIATAESCLVQVEELDQRILDILIEDDCTEQEIASEYESKIEYQEKVRVVKARIQQHFGSTRSSSPDPSEFVSAVSQSASVMANNANSGPKRRQFKLPKVELKKFNGDLKEWLGFWSQFEKIHQDEDLHDSDKFQYLVQSIVSGSRAYDLVTSYPQSSANYPKAVAALKERFGNEKLLTQAYVRELTKLVLNNAKEKFKLSNLYDQLQSHLRSLESIGVTMQEFNRMLLPLVESCLSEELLKAWNRENRHYKDESKSELHNLMEFLRVEIETEESIRLAHSERSSSKLNESKRNDHGKKRADSKDESGGIPTAAGLFAIQQSCVFCEKPHPSQECGKAVSMGLKAKQEKIKEKRACFSCLKLGHPSKNCKAFIKCQACTKKHYPVICPILHPAELEDKKEVNSVDHTHSKLSCSDEIVLKTLIVTVENEITGQKKKIRALCDSGSQRSYMLKSTAEELNLQSQSEVQIRHLLFGGKEDIQKHKKYRVNLCSHNGKFKRTFEVLDHEKICQPLPRVSKGKWMDELKKNRIFITDLGEGMAPIEMLIGADYYSQMFTGKKYQLSNGLAAWQTQFGWTLCGKNRRQAEDSSVALTVVSMLVSEASMSELWRLDVIGINDPVQSHTKQEEVTITKQHFQETVTRCEAGRYSVSLPWIDGVKKIPDNRLVAEKRLESMTRRLITVEKITSRFLWIGWKKILLKK